MAVHDVGSCEIIDLDARRKGRQDEIVAAHVEYEVGLYRGVRRLAPLDRLALTEWLSERLPAFDHDMEEIANNLLDR